jgi:hypothetical protein
MFHKKEYWYPKEKLIVEKHVHTTTNMLSIKILSIYVIFGELFIRVGLSLQNPTSTFLK